MIKVTLGKPPAILLSKGAEELAKVLRYYRKKRPPKKAFKFAVYKQPEVVQLLNARFFFKCAYCESRYGATQPVDVEHYRPKSAVVEGRRKLIGYYWLASDWSNLLPSCADCNRPRKHRRPDGTVATSGKSNQFPLANPEQRATAPGEHRRERALLLHPCRCKPSRHFKFDALGMVIPKSRRGKVTIEVCALFRPQLVNERRERLVLILGVIERARKLRAILDDEPGNARVLAVLEDELRQLKRFTRPCEPYSAMAQQFVDAFFEEM